MGIEGYNKTVSSTKAVPPTIDVSNLFTHTYDKKVNYQGTGPQEVDDLSIDLDKYMDIEITYTQAEDVPWHEKVFSILGVLAEGAVQMVESTVATMAVATTSVLSGVLDVGESLFDGVTWVAASGADLLGFDDAAKGMREFIARDLVSEANQAFYEGTKIGQWYNENSFMKYDSKLAQGIRSVSETATTFVAATFLTVGTGGLASIPIGAATIPAATVTAGFLSNAGEKAEEIYQETNADTTIGKEAQIFMSGVGGAASWYFQGQAGAKAYTAIKDGSFQAAVQKSVTSGKTALHNTKETLKTAFNDAKTGIQTDGLGTTLKNGASSVWSTAKAGGKEVLNTLKSNAPEAVKKSVFDVGDNIEFATDHADSFLSGEKEFTLDALGAVLVEWGTDKAVNIIGEGEENVIDDFLDDIDDGLDREVTHALRDKIKEEKPIVDEVMSGYATLTTAAQEESEEASNTVYV